jgi:hypothetical protein
MIDIRRGEYAPVKIVIEQSDENFWLWCREQRPPVVVINQYRPGVVFTADINVLRHSFKRYKHGFELFFLPCFWSLRNADAIGEYCFFVTGRYPGGLTRAEFRDRVEIVKPCTSS